MKFSRVGSCGSRVGGYFMISAGVLSEVTIIQAKGMMIEIDTAMSTRWRAVFRKGFCSENFCIPASLVHVIHPAFGQAEVEPGDEEQDNEQDPAHHSRLPHLEIGEGELVDIHHQGVGGQQRTSRAAGDDVYLPEDI